LLVGHNAQYQSYTCIENTSGLALTVEIGDKRETNYVSMTLELYTMLRCLHTLDSAHLLDLVDCMITDQHTQVTKFFSAFALLI
jgi:hypothetical protein